MASERGCPASRLLLVTYCVPQFTISSRILSGKAAHPSPSGMSPPSGHPYFLFTAHSRCVIIRHPDWVTPQFTQNQLLRPEVPCIRFAWPHPSTGHYVELTPNSVPPVRLGPCPPPHPSLSTDCTLSILSVNNVCVSPRLTLGGKECVRIGQPYGCPYMRTSLHRSAKAREQEEVHATVVSPGYATARTRLLPSSRG